MRQTRQEGPEINPPFAPREAWSRERYRDGVSVPRQTSVWPIELYRKEGLSDSRKLDRKGSGSYRCGRRRRSAPRYRPPPQGFWA